VDETGDDWMIYVYSLNLRTGRYPHSGAVSRAGMGCFADPTRANVSDLVAKRDGAIAWIQYDCSATVRASDAGGNRIFDGADPHSLRLTGSTLTWTNAGTPQTASLN